jgi:nucleoside 2-deoxyribosyltransferase
LPALTASNIEEMERTVPISVMEKSKRLLLWIASKSRFPGDRVSLELDKDYPLVYGRNSSELSYFLKHLAKLGFVEQSASLDPATCTITPGGWSETETIRKTEDANPKAFVAMWFAAEMTPLYEDGIRPAIELDAGFMSVRVDAIQHNDKIDDRIIAEIKESRFLVADFTGQRGGVYFEAGYAMGLGLPVIWLCREDEISKVHFDTRQYNHIVWKEAADLREKLALRIRATVGLGPVANR